MTFQRRRIEGRPAVPTRFGTCRLAQLQGDREIFRDRPTALLGLLLLAQQTALEFAELLLRLPNLGPQKAQIGLHGLGGVLDVVELAELVKHTREGLGDGRHQGLLLVGDHRQDRYSDLLDLTDEGYEVVGAAAEHLAAEEGLPGEDIDDEIEDGVALAELDPVDNRQNGALLLESLAELAVLHAHLTAHQSEVVPELILHAHGGDGYAPLPEPGMDLWEAEAVTKAHRADGHDHVQPKPAPGQRERRFLWGAEAKVRGGAAGVEALLVAKREIQALIEQPNAAVAVLGDPQRATAGGARLLGCREDPLEELSPESLPP